MQYCFLKKKSIQLFSILFLVNKSYTVEANFSMNTWTGFSSCSIIENVYSDGIKESELKWENYKPLLGVDLSYKYKLETIDYNEDPNIIKIGGKDESDYINNIYIKVDLGAYTAFPIAAGIVEDRDFSVDSLNNLIKYSNHNLITDKDYSLYSNICFHQGNEKFNLGVGFSARYSNIKMESDDGYLQYAPNGKVWTGKETKENLNGTAISYEQSRKMIGNIFYINAVICKKVPVSFTVYYYPEMTVEAIDNHFLRSTQFYDTMKSGYTLDFSLSIGWIFKENCFFYSKVNYEFFNSQGTTRVNSLGIVSHDTYDIKDNYTASTEYSNWIFSIGLSIGL